MTHAISIRPERAADLDQIRKLNVTAFGGDAEADLVDELRDRCRELISLVAESEDDVIGHIAFSPVILSGPSGERHGMGLAPMSVQPDRQRQGIGSELVRAGLEELRLSGVSFVVVLGHPEYYPRFGFRSSTESGIRSEFPGIPDGVFMVLPLAADVRLESGVVRYHETFDVFK